MNRDTTAKYTTLVRARTGDYSTRCYEHFQRIFPFDKIEACRAVFLFCIERLEETIRGRKGSRI